MTLINVLELRIAAESLAEAPGIVSSTLAATRAFEGCLSAEVAIDVLDPAHYVIVEKWTSLEADDAYRAWRATPEGASALRTIVAEAPVLSRSLLHDEI